MSDVPLCTVQKTDSHRLSQSRSGARFSTNVFDTAPLEEIFTSVDGVVEDLSRDLAIFVDQNYHE